MALPLQYLVFILIMCVGCTICYKAYLFVGPYKTGSTEIESIITSNHIIFESYYNVHIIGKKNSKEVAYDLLFPILRNQKLTDNRLLQEISNNNSDIFIASEVFCDFSKDRIFQLKKILGNYTEVIVIANHRAHLQRERSEWSEINKKKIDKTISDVVEYIHQKNNLDTIGKRISFLSDYAKVFGKNNIKVISYEGALEKYDYHPAALFMALIDVLKFNVSHFHFNNIYKNPSPTIFHLDFIRQIQLYSALSMNESILKASKLQNQMKIITKNEIYFPTKTIDIFPSPSHVQDDIELSNIYEYFFPPHSNDIYRNPLALELLCIECFSSNKSATSKWVNMMNELRKV